MGKKKQTPAAPHTGDLLSIGLTSNYNPDILSCLANLSNDEVFTPPAIANAMLDMLPQSLFEDPDATFLDPCSKTGVFLREIAKRLIAGLETKIPDLQKRLDHIYHKQLFGIAITELTGHISRRTLYCSKDASSAYTVSKFDNPDGNIRYKVTEHTWKDGKCIYCGTSQQSFEGRTNQGLESHAYEFIHTKHAEALFNMKFDVIIGNPPYQLETKGNGKQSVQSKGKSNQAKPIYDQFVMQAKKLNPKYISMIIPSRWFAGGMGLDAFRNNMMNDKSITSITDYINSKECFAQNSISGGVCYFLWDRDNPQEKCKITSVHNGKRTIVERSLSEFEVLVRYNEGVNIIHKIIAHNEECLDMIISPLMPFGIPTNQRGDTTKQHDEQYSLYTSDGVFYINKSCVTKGFEYISSYKVMLSKTGAEHAGEPDKEGMFRVFPSTMKVLCPNEICTHSYFIIGNCDNKESANNILSYLKTRFVRFLVLLSMSSINLSKLVFSFVPMQDFSKPWTDEELYEKYGLTQEEIDFIESMIKPME